MRLPIAAGKRHIFYHSLREWSPSFCGRRRGVAAKPPQVTVSCLSGTTKGRSPSGGFAIARWKPSPTHSSNYVKASVGKVAAALSAAVTTTKPIGDRTQLTGGTKPEEATNPNASRSSGEGVWGRGASLREAASPPESLHPTSLREGARGRGLLFREAPSLANKLYLPLNNGSSAFRRWESVV